MYLLIIVILLFLAELFYFRVADRYNIIDKPNERSSHTKVTLRGGGIIFYFGALAYFLTSGFEYPCFLLALRNSLSFFISKSTILKLGLIALMDNQYKIKSNRESGDGRYDISLIPREKKYPGIIMELKWKSGLEKHELEELSMEALKQIDEKRYNLELKEEGIDNLIKLGIAFSGKKVVIKAK